MGQRPCKVRLLNYRGAKREPFWNCLTIHPIFHQKELVLFVARLRDYSYRLNKLISLKPAQFCKSSDEHLQCRIRLSELAQARTLARAYSIDASPSTWTGGAIAAVRTRASSSPPCPSAT